MVSTFPGPPRARPGPGAIIEYGPLVSCLIQLGVWGAESPPAGPGQSPGRGPGGEAPGSFLDFAV